MRNVLAKKIATIILVLIGLSTISLAQNVSEEKILVDNERDYAFYQVDGQNLILTLELIDDFTDNTQGDFFPNVDFVTVKVDVDKNAEVSKYIDVSYGLLGKQKRSKEYWEENIFVTRLCSQFLLTSNTATQCDVFETNAVLDFGFRSSEKQPEKHPVYKFTIPLKELSNDQNSARVRLTFFSAGKNLTHYPAKDNEPSHSFLKTLEIVF